MKLRVFREKVNLTQKELGLAIGVKQHTVSQWETGERVPHADKLPQLASILGCTVDELLAENEK